MTKLKMFLPIIALVVLLSAIVGCGLLPGGGAGTSPTAVPAAPGAPVAPGAPTTAPIAAPLVTLTAIAQPTAAVVVPTSAPPRIALTPTPTTSPDPRSLLPAASPLCEKAFASPVPLLTNVAAPESPILTLFNKEYEGRTWLYNPITTIRYATDANNVRSLLCIVETRKQTDKYPDGSPLYQVTWEARFLRWPDGQISRATNAPHMQGGIINILFPKPAGTEFYGGRPDPALQEFVKLATGS